MALKAIKTKRLKATKYPGRYSIPPVVGKMVLKNISSEDIYLSFDGDKTDDSYLLERGRESPIINVKENVMHYCTKEHDGHFCLLLWEKD